MKTKIIAFLLVLALLAPTVLSSVAQESNETASAASAQSEPFDYASLYKQDDLVVSFSAYGQSAGDAPTTLTDHLGNTFSAGEGALFGDGVLLNRGAMIDFTDALNSKLNNTHYTYEIVFGYEEMLANTSATVESGAFDVGVLTHKVTYTPEGVTEASAYAPLKNGSESSLIYHFGSNSPSGKPLLDTETASEVLEITETATLSTSASNSTVSFTFYRNGATLLRLSSNESYTNFQYVPSLACRLGKDLNMKIYAVRVYNDLLTDSARAQNHFVDVAAYYGLDLTSYLALSTSDRAKVHNAFASVRVGSDELENPQEHLELLVALKGKLPAVDLTSAMTFEGYAVRLWDAASVRAEFSLDTSLIAAAEAAGMKLEYGAVLMPKDATGASLVYDGTSKCFRPADPSYLHVSAYSTGAQKNAPARVTIATESKEGALVRDEEYVFRGYVGIVNGKTGYAYLFDAESPLFGNTASLGMIYDFFMVNGYDAYPAVLSGCGEETVTFLHSLKAELDEAYRALAAVEAQKDALATLEKLASDAYASSLLTSRAPYDAFSDAYTAYFAYEARAREIESFDAALATFADALDTLSVKIAELSADLSAEEQKTYSKVFTALLYARHESFAAYADALTSDTALSTEYANAVSQRKAALNIENAQNKTLNAYALDDYAIFGDADDRVTRLLTKTLLTEYGMALPLLPASLYEYAAEDCRAILLDRERVHTTYGESVLDMDGSTLLLYGNAENSLHYAVLKLFALLEEKDRVMIEEKITVTPADVGTQYYAVDSFFRPDGSLNTESSEPLTIVCIGGSLTELGREWVRLVKEYFQEAFPNRPVEIYNAGVGGTGSRFGSARFENDVLSKNPDLVIIEFSVNDASANKENSQIYMENMIYQCLQAEKIPGIIYAHTPQAADQEDPLYAKYLNQVLYKEELTKHYGISVVDIYEYFFRCYEAEKVKTGNSALTYNEYISDIYKKDASGAYDVHPLTSGCGYKMYAEAFIEAFDSSLSSMLSRPKLTDILCSGNTSTVKATYEYVPQNSERITYDGTWEVWTAEKPYSNADTNAKIGTHRYVYPFMADGVRRAYKQTGAAFTITTTAQEISLYYHGAVAGCEATVFVNGIRKGTVNVQTPNQQPFQSSAISLGNPSGEEVTVRVVVNDATATNYVFQFGYVIETFK